ncbi:MAG: sigma-70 family RNA polymerase sigma factor [Bacteroidetes bacterium]|nr:sigma-70 family RNA polymerase sigma factor [Bacteroidota bacterium]
MPYKLFSDNDLIRNFQEGNHNCLEVLICRHKKSIFANIVKVVKDKQLAEDIFQDTFFKVINKLKAGQYNDQGKFLPWVLTISHNLAIDYFRKSKRLQIVDNKDEYNAYDNIKVFDDCIEDKMITEQIHKDVRALLDLLPDDQKEVLMLRNYSEMSFKEIAEHTNVSINTALGRMRYAIINLRKMVKEKDIILNV